MIPIQLFAGLNKFQRIVRKNDLGFILDVGNFDGFSLSPELIWFCMDNIDSIELPGLAQPLHICVACSTHDLQNLVVCCSHIATCFGNL